MRRSIATVSLSGMLREKVEAIAAAGFDAFELFENDLLQFSGSPRDVRALAADLGLAIDMFQPFRDFDGARLEQVQRSLDRAERKFDLMGELGTDLLLVCSNVQPEASGDIEQLAEQYAMLAERAQRRGLRIAYEALAWGRQIKLYAQAWAVVQRVNRPNFGLTLDSFHTLALRDDPAGIARIPAARIFYVQLADAPWVQTDVLSHSRHFRCFPGQGEFDVTGFLGAVLDAGYRGTISLEVFNDEFRSAPARANAGDAMRSLLWLEEQVRLTRPPPPSPPAAAALFEAPPAPRLAGWSFIEFAVDPQAADRLAALLVALGFALHGRHRTRGIDLYALGEVRLLLNQEPDSYARSYFEIHGASACALALTTADACAAIERARALGCATLGGCDGANELSVPSVTAPDGSLVYFCAPAAGRAQAFEADFEPVAAAATPAPAGGARIDHVVRAVPAGQINPWVLFQRAVLGLVPRRQVVLHDPYGVLRSREIESDDGAVRTSLIVSERDNTVVSRSVSRFFGAGVQQIAIAVDDIFATLAELHRRGAPMLPVPANYHDDLQARYDLDPALLESLRRHGLLYERDERGGEFLHAYAAPFDARFEFEFVQRRGGYDHYGATNSPVRLAALAEHLHRD
ncbi:MAG: TIM barrel protein [Burkholderiales bacterium]|nr:sugar phosphate isomerase/epimerase and 4-hydroxyphenylpyruvate domain-containing protein [Burkholderiales bacterium]MDE1925747.1 TIM barrel protein [Burkholderiales bacterium]MDE2158267.1 TIM barrel protein [Burkholderiales bacterium]MDE2502583.1 TIM barrel protein [Burkholderiales bacterium]